MEFDYECVKLEQHDGISWLYMHRPNKKNAMSPQLHYEMDEGLARLEADPETKLVVISGSGGNFSAGQDLKKFFRELEDKPSEAKKAQESANRWRFERLWNYEKPTIAMIHGFCVGGAFMQLLSTDFAITADNATFSLSEVNWGILPGALVAKLVADACLPRRALYYSCTGEAFDGYEAERIGLVDKVVPEDDLVEEVEKLAKVLLEKSPAVLRATKQAVRQVRTMDHNQAADYLAEKNMAIRYHDERFNVQSSYHTGLKQFLDDKSYRPVYESFKAVPLITDQRDGDDD
ncbi:MAG: p-hydroxycinnamoyl CoA hydratase/lyase [Pseudomonadota bacterium]|nr:p-hydroxycinnamoyl CoA hydratase/lyase [Pseudomonadota bacterium]